MTKTKTIGVTGHRNLSHSEANVKHVLRVGLKHLLEEKGYTLVITGMAMGFDQLVKKPWSDRRKSRTSIT